MHPEQFGPETVFSVVAILGIFMIVFLISLIPTIFYLLTLQKAMNRCTPESQAMSPGLVWLQLIPLFNIVWHFFIVINISKSLENEFSRRNMSTDPDPGKTLGLAMCILTACSCVPLLGPFAGIAGFVCWIIYWVKIHGYSSQLANAQVSAQPDPAQLA